MSMLPEKMKAAIMKEPLRIEIEEVDVPEPRGNEVLVKVMAVGVCGSDIHYYEHGRIGNYIVEKPMILGHECAGIVAQIGPDVRNLQVGDRVAIEPGVTCGKCENCKAGRYNLCPDVEFLATPPYDGAFVQYLRHREDFLFKIPHELSFEEAALNEPFSVGIHAAKRLQIEPGSTVAIMGMGPVGLMAVVAAKAFGASKIIVTDLEDNRLEAAKALGAHHAINVRTQDANQVIKELTDGKGADAALETAGNPKALQTALGALKRGGKLAVIGLPAQNEVGLHIPFISEYEVEIYGIFRYANTYPQGIQFLSSGISDLSLLITDRYELDQTQEAMERARTNKAGSLKVVVYPNGFVENEN
ncbi:NAD(P)-dependent alcohol dehydrogenase [Paenibacillus elgii]|uniref:NAD(P)-dependent alcohol dehydrogenase n=1 Tax=Paenibacillus elgii TaxID=189691 RepID=UPI0020416E3C|nr:NAD(P)-dependent alcohol dehydrogenase [Paenibacillus elgii]MCM3270842.1 NAD(P)-dependent alcohol dehydrogenase [Paenibacillus elgii]